MAKKVTVKKETSSKTAVAKSNSKKTNVSAKKSTDKIVSKKSSLTNQTSKSVSASKTKSAATPAKSSTATLSINKLDKVKKSTPKVEKKLIIESKPVPTVIKTAILKPVKSILISQPKPELGKSPYIDLAQHFKIKLDWRPFTHVEGIKAADFRKQKIYIEQYSCVVFTSRIAIEQYFRICEELRIKISEDNKYFCTNEAIALYLQKFIQYRKRKVFYGDGRLPKLMEVIVKHKEDGSFLLPCSNVRDKALIEAFAKYNIQCTEAFIYNTVASDLSDLSDVKYDMLIFFNPSAIDSLYTNFPKFKQDETRLAIFGNTTADAVKAHKLNINIFAPTPENPSLVDAIKKYIIEANKKLR